MRVAVRIPASPTISAGGISLNEFRDRVGRADTYGFDRISVGDTQLDNIEVFTALAAAATWTHRAGLGPGVTNPVTRDVGVMANVLASLDVLSNGRAYCLIGRGDGAVRNAGLRGATVDEIRAYVVALRELLDRGVAKLGDREVRLPWASRYEHRVPVYLVAEGPRMLQLAGEIADGAFVGAGLQPELVDWARQHVHDGARRACRDPAAVDLWWDTRSGIADTREAALERARESLASAGNHALRSGNVDGLPAELVARLRAYQSRFDYSQKGKGSQNGPLMDELGLTSYFLDRFGVVGTVEEVTKRLRALAAIGVDQVSLATHDRGQPGTDSLTLLGEGVLPAIR